jgi:DNA-directed RNA polymerase subunit RPC12/RpoP
MAGIPSENQDEQIPPELPPGSPGDSGDAVAPRANDVGADPVGQTFDSGEGRIFPCDGCGADLEFRIGDQVLACQFCGHVKQIELSDDAAVIEQDFHSMLERIRQWREQAAQKKVAAGDEAHAGVSTSLNELRCDSCGGNVEFIGTLTSTHCPYCGSPVQLENAHKCVENRIPVDGVLPFQIERQQAKTNLQQWVDSRWFAPNSFRKQGAEGKFNGVYLSYFTVDSMTFTAYTGQRGEHYWVEVGSGKNKRREMRTRWYPASGRFQRFFDDVVVLANTGLNRKFMLALEPWPLAKVVAFNQQMLAGHLARTYDIELDECFHEAKSRIDDTIQTDVRQRIGGDTQRVQSVNSRYEAITYKHLLLPVWLLAYKYSDKTYQVFINAATGEVQGERPYSVWKIAFAVITGLTVAGVIAAMSQQ